MAVTTTGAKDSRPAARPSGQRLLWAGASLAAVTGGWLLLTHPGSVPHRPLAGPPAAALTTTTALVPATRPTRTTRAPSPPTPGPTVTFRAVRPRPTVTAGPTAVPPARPTLDGQPLTDASTDVLAGDLTDAQLQQLLEQVTPPTSPPGLTAVPAAWAALLADLGGRGWTQLHQQAAVIQQADPYQPTPPAVDVTVLWSGTAPNGTHAERRRAVVYLTAAAQGWQEQGIS